MKWLPTLFVTTKLARFATLPIWEEMFKKYVLVEGEEYRLDKMKQLLVAARMSG